MAWVTWFNRLSLRLAVCFFRELPAKGQKGAHYSLVLLVGFELP